jgi:hypothetical protein
MTGGLASKLYDEIPAKTQTPNGPLPNGPLPNGPLPNGPLPNGPLPNGTALRHSAQISPLLIQRDIPLPYILRPSLLVLPFLIRIGAEARRSCASQVCIRIERVSANVTSVLARVVGTSFLGGVQEGWRWRAYVKARYGCD